MNIDIAIVGMSCRFPDADSIETYWKNLKEGKISIKQLSEHELKLSGIPNTIFSQENYIRAASYINDIENFDASFFRYAPREAAILDPQQRIMLELSYEALESAGYNHEHNTQNVGVFMGSGYNQYLLKNILKGRDITDNNEEFFIQISNDKDYLASRISYKLNLHGPSVNIQTACSTSLVAVHFARKSLLANECDWAIAGGITLRLPQKQGYFYEQEMIVSNDGKCRPFDKDANGTVFGSGGGVIVLRRLEDALKDGDNILCIIKGSAINNDGQNKVGYTAPSLSGQQAVLNGAVQNANIPVETISAIEAHGTGTKMGDPIEFDALSSVFKGVKRRCCLGSVKGNIGHLENAAGIAGLIKMVLSLKNKTLVPCVNYTSPNPFIDIENSPFYINTETKYWDIQNGNYPRRCGVSSFGIGGTNAHVILEEYENKKIVSDHDKTQDYYPVNISADSIESLSKNKDVLLEFIHENPEVELSALSYTLCCRRNIFKYRHSYACSSIHNLSELLSKENDLPTAANDFDIAFMFPGQGSQFLGMAEELYNQNGVFKEEFERLILLFKLHIDVNLYNVWRGLDKSKDINDTIHAQPLLFIIEYALGKQLIAWGIAPNILIGHSIGEYAAFCLADMISLEDAVKLVSKRALLMNGINKGKMYSIHSEEEIIKPMLLSGLSIAAINTKDLLVVSGDENEIEKFLQVADANGINHKQLHTSAAFHSCLMQSILSDFYEAAKTVTFSPAKIRIASTLSGEIISIGQSISAEYLMNQIRQPVRFMDASTSILKMAPHIFIEAGPGNTLKTFIKRIDHRANAVNILSTANSDGNSLHVLISALGNIWKLGIRIIWESLFPSNERILVPLPTYQFDRKRFWIQPSEHVKQENETIYKNVIAHEDAEKPQANINENLLSAKQNKLLKIFSSVLGIENVRLEDNFFEMGGHSLLATRILSRINKEFSRDIRLKEFMEYPTIKVLADKIEESDDVDSGLPPVLEDMEHLYEPFPLTEMQEAQWLGRIEAFNTSNVAAHLYFEVENYDLCPITISKAWQKLIERHDMLRTIILEDGTQKVLPLPREYKVRINDYSNYSMVVTENKLQETRGKMDSVVRPIDEWPLFEVQCSVLPQNKVRIHFSIDLIICDVASLRIIMNEWALLYSDTDRELPEINLKFRDYVLAERKIKECNVYKISESYWNERIKTLPGRPELPLKNQSFIHQPRYKRLSYTIETILWERLKEVAGKKKVSPSMILLAGFSEILACWSQNKSFCINTTIINRHPLHQHVNRLVGEFASFAPIEVNLKEAVDFESLVLNLQQENWNNLENRYVHGTTILRKIAKERGKTTGAVLPIVFTSTIVHDASGENFFHEVFGDYHYVLSQTPQVWLDHAVFENVHGLMLSWHFIDNVFEDGLINEMFNTYIEFILSLCNQTANWKHHYYDLIPSANFDIIEKYNATRKEIPETSLHDLFFNSYSTFTDKTAVISKGERLSYGRLHELVLFYSSVIKEKNIERDNPIIILMEKGWEQIVAMLSILNAGYAYLPLMIETPVERVKYIIEETDCKLIISISKHREQLTSFPCANVVYIENVPVDLSKIDMSKVIVSPTDTAYIIYTSGSTGKPKGVVISHKGASNTIIDVNNRFKIKSSDSIFALSELSFDLSVYDIFGMLAVGGTIVMPESHMAKDPESWHRLITEHKVSIWNTVPALMEMYAEYVSNISESTYTSIRLALLSGDWIHLPLPDKLRTLNPEMEIISLGGATEASIWSIYYPIHHVLKEWKSIPYGKPLANQTILILDDSFKVCPIYTVGNIYIGGVGVANGYYKDKEKTEMSFIKLDGEKDIIYKTGDLGRMLPDGNVEFLGRSDSQVKIGGYRIELGEIESCISAIEEINACTVVLTLQKRRLKAFIQFNEGAYLNTDEILAKLNLILPHYMIPQELVILSVFPLNSNGKIDRNRLSEDNNITEDGEKNDLINIEEKDIAKYNAMIEVFAETLGLDKSVIDINQNFFSMGGDSILGVKIISKLKQHGITLSSRMIFEHPTIRELVEECTLNRDEKTVEGNIIRLSSFQQSLIDYCGDDIFSQNHIVLLELKKQLDPERLDAEMAKLCSMFDLLKGRLSKIKDRWELHVNFNSNFEIDFVENIPEKVSFNDYVTSLTNDFSQDFHSGETPLFRLCLLLHDNKSYLLIISNKLILDLYSIDLFLKLLLNNLYYGAGISKEISEKITSLNDIAAIYNSLDTQINKTENQVNVNQGISVHINIGNKYSKVIEDLGQSEIINLLIRSIISSTEHLNKNRCPLYVRYTTPRDYENLLEHSLEFTCGNFLKTYILRLERYDSPINYKKMRDMIINQSLDITTRTPSEISEVIPNIEVIYYGNLCDNTPYYSVLCQKGNPLRSRSEISIEAFVLNNQLDISIYLKEGVANPNEFQKRFKNNFLKGISSIEKDQMRDYSEYDGLQISKDNFNELISK